MPNLGHKILKIHRFPHFSPICFDILSWDFVYDFVQRLYRSGPSTDNFCQFLWDLCPYWTLEYWKYSFPLFSYMIWHIVLVFCIWLFFTVLSNKFEWRQFASILVWVMPLFELRIMTIQFSALFSCLLLHIELKFCIWLCLTLLQPRLEWLQFSSIFIGVMPLLELRILIIHSFPHFSLTCFHILSTPFTYDFVLLHYRLISSVLNPNQLFTLEVPFSETKNTGNTQFPHFSTMCFDIFSWKCSYYFVKCSIDQVRVSSVYVRLALRPSIYFQYFSPTCIDKFSWNLKYDVGFFNAFLLEKNYKK